MLQRKSNNLYILLIIFTNVCIFGSSLEENKYHCNVPELNPISFCKDILYKLSNFKTVHLDCDHKGIYNNNTSSLKCEFDFTTNNIFKRVTFVQPVSLTMTSEDNVVIDWDSSYFAGLEQLYKLNIHNFTISKNTSSNLLEKFANLGIIIVRSDGILDVFFKSSSNLEVLIWYINNSVRIEWKTFQYIKKLERLDIIFNKSIIIDNYAFIDFKKLTSLSLSSSHPAPCVVVNGNYRSYDLCNSADETIANFLLFEMLRNLKYLYLRKCEMTFIPKKIFWSDNLNLKKLDLSYNSITKVPTMFCNIHTLSSLHLNNNKIKYIEVYAFSLLPLLEFLYLNNNQIVVFYQTPGEQQMSYQEYLTVDLSYNFISNTSVYESFMNCRRGLHLNLSHNKLKELPNVNVTVFKRNMLGMYKYIFLRTEVELDLSYNLIEDIYIKNTNLEKGLFINIENNPINCQCGIFDFIDWLNKNKYEENQYDINEYFRMKDLRCFSPQPLKKKFVRDLKPEEILCYFNKSTSDNVNCPDHCICYSQPSFKHFIVNCSNIGLTALPAHLPKANSSFETHVYLNNNKLTSMYKAGLGYEDIVSIHLENNNISAIMWLPQKLKVLKLNNNNLKYLNQSLIDMLSNISSLESIYLHENPWKCICKNKYLLWFIKQQYHRIGNLNKIKCDGDITLNILSESDLCSNNILSVFITTTVIITLVIIIVLTIIFYKYNTEIKVWLFAHRLCICCFREEELDKDKEYDAFVSYSHEDEVFVAHELVPELEQGENPFKLCVHHRDWLGGDRIAAQIARSVQNSRRTLIVLTPAFLSSVWAKIELQTAHRLSLKEKRPKVIIILLKEIGPTEDLGPELRAYLTMNTYIDRRDRLFWQKLRYALPHPPRLTRSERKAARRIEIEMLKLEYPSLEPIIEEVE